MELRRSVTIGRPVPALPSWLTEPPWDRFAALLPQRPVYDPTHPMGSHRPRVSDRIIFGKLLQLLRFGCSYEAVADTTCSATTIRNRRHEWIQLGVFAQLPHVALEMYDRSVGLVLQQIAVDGSITKAPGGGEAAGSSPVDRGELDAGYDSGKTRTTLDELPGYAAGSPTRARRPPSRPLNAGTWSAPMPGRTPSAGLHAATNAGSRSLTPSSTSRTFTPGVDRAAEWPQRSPLRIISFKTRPGRLASPGRLPGSR